MKRFNDKGYELYEFDFSEEQIKQLNKSCARIVARNSKMITEECEKRLNPEYEANACRQHELRAQVYGRDKNFVKNRTMALERQDEAKATDIHPIVWREEKPQLKPKKLSFLEKLAAWRDSVKERWWFKLLPPY